MINPPSIVSGQCITVDHMRRLGDSIRSARIFAGYGIKVEAGPDGARVSLAEPPQAVAAVAQAHELPKPWDATIRQTEGEKSAGIKFDRTWTNMGGVYSRVSLLFSEGVADMYTSFPAVSAKSSFIVAARLSATVDDKGARVKTGSIVFYPESSEGWEQLETAGTTLLDSYLLPLYVVTFTPGPAPADPGIWSISADLRTTPAVIVYA